MKLFRNGWQAHPPSVSLETTSGASECVHSFAPLRPKMPPTKKLEAVLTHWNPLEGHSEPGATLERSIPNRSKNSTYSTPFGDANAGYLVVLSHFVRLVGRVLLSVALCVSVLAVPHELEEPWRTMPPPLQFQLSTSHRVPHLEHGSPRFCWQTCEA